VGHVLHLVLKLGAFGALLVDFTHFTQPTNAAGSYHVAPWVCRSPQRRWVNS